MQYLGLPEKSCSEKNSPAKNCLWLLASSEIVSIQTQPPRRRPWHLDAGVHPDARAEDKQFIYTRIGLILASPGVGQWELPDQLPALPSLLAQPWLPCRQALLTDKHLFYRLDLALLEALCH